MAHAALALLTTLLLAAIAPSTASIAAVTACQSSYSSSEQSCSDLVILGHCLAQATQGDSAELIEAADFFLEQAQAGRDCSNSKIEEQAYMMSEDGGLNVNVGEDQDVKFFRFRRETVSIWELVSRIEKLEAAETDKIAPVRERVDALNATVVALAAKLDESLTAINETLAAALQEERENMEAHVDTQITELRGDVSELFDLLNVTLHELNDKVNEQELHSSCLEIFEAGKSAGNGLYLLKSGHSVYCDMANGGWTRLYYNTLTSNHDDLTYEAQCPCSSFGHDSDGWHTGVSSCPGTNPSSFTVQGTGAAAATQKYAWRWTFDKMVDVGLVNEVRHTALHHNNHGYDHTDWPTVELVSASPMSVNGEYGSAVRLANGNWQWFARYSLGTIDISTGKKAGVQYTYPYFTFLYEDGGPGACDTSNSDGFDIRDVAIWVR